MQKLVECRDLLLGYGTHVLAPCPDFNVGPGDCLCVVGHNGSGKTTLLKCIAGLAKPLAGAIEFASDFEDGQIGYLPQQGPMQRDFPASVREVVQSGCQARRGWRPFYSRGEKRRALAAMVRLGIAPLADRCYRELSGGQRQKTLLARALCGNCRLLLLDEPTNGLDAEATADFYRLISRLSADGLAIVMVTHDLTAALAASTHILTLGEDASFKTNERHG